MQHNIAKQRELYDRTSCCLYVNTCSQISVIFISTMASAPPTAAATCSLGTGHTPYRPVVLEVLGPATGDIDLFHCLCMQDEFESFSQEELRLADYETGPAFAGATTSDPAHPKRISAPMCNMLTTNHTNHEGSGTSDDDPFHSLRSAPMDCLNHLSVGMDPLHSMQESGRLRIGICQNSTSATVRHPYLPSLALHSFHSTAIQVSLGRLLHPSRLSTLRPTLPCNPSPPPQMPPTETKSSLSQLATLLSQISPG